MKPILDSCVAVCTHLVKLLHINLGFKRPYSCRLVCILVNLLNQGEKVMHYLLQYGFMNMKHNQGDYHLVR